MSDSASRAFPTRIHDGTARRSALLVVTDRMESVSTFRVMRVGLTMGSRRAGRMATTTKVTHDEHETDGLIETLEKLAANVALVC